MNRINKLLIAFILLTLCSGCTINYNLKITKDTVEESIEINDTVMEGRSKNDILIEYERWFPAYIDAENGTPTDYDSSMKSEGFEYHNKNIQELNNGYYYTYKYTYPIDKYQSATAIREAYGKRKFYVENDYIVINTDKKNLLCNYSYFEELEVSISIDPSEYKVNNTNADETIGNTYIWNIDRNNCDDSEILLQLDNINKITNEPSNNNNNNNNKSKKDYSLYIFSGILIVIILAVYIYFNKLTKKNKNMD